LDQEALPNPYLAEDPGETSETLARHFESTTQRIENLGPPDESACWLFGR
jgi:hypothetical protein